MTKPQAYEYVDSNPKLGELLSILNCHPRQIEHGTEHWTKFLEVAAWYRSLGTAAPAAYEAAASSSSVPVDPRTPPPTTPIGDKGPKIAATKKNV